MSDISCGVRELVGLDDDPKTLIASLLDDEYEEYVTPNFRFSQVIFSDNLNEAGVNRKRVGGVRLAKWIRDNDLGQVIETRAIKNRNTGNTIKTWIWNVSNIRKVIKATGWQKPKEVDYGYFW